MRQFILLIFLLIFSFQGALYASPDDLKPEDEEVEVEMKVYPNPVRNNEVTVSLEEASFLELRMVNITGREIIKKSFDLPQHKTVVRLFDVPNGIYIMQIKTGDQRLIAKKVSVSRR